MEPAAQYVGFCARVDFVKVMPRPDYYELLDVAPSASPAELKLAYYRQAKKYHPDLNAGNTEAEERFKLVADAYRVLGDERERQLYDEARERDLRYADAPELAGMQRKMRFSARAGRMRNDGRRRPVRRRFGVLPMRRKMPWWVTALICLFWVSALLPMVMRPVGVRQSAPEPKAEKKDPPDDVVRARLATMRADLEAAAAAGDARAQLRLGLLLYSGSAGVQLNRAAARVWWEKAAAQGNKAAAYYLEKCDFAQPPSPENEEP